MNDKALVFEVPHPKGAVPEPTVKFSDTEERVWVGSDTVMVQFDIRMMTFALPVDVTVMSARPFRDGMLAEPPLVSQKTSIAML